MRNVFFIKQTSITFLHLTGQTNITLIRCMGQISRQALHEVHRANKQTSVTFDSTKAFAQCGLPLGWSATFALSYVRAVNFDVSYDTWTSIFLPRWSLWRCLSRIYQGAAFQWTASIVLPTETRCEQRAAGRALGVVEDRLAFFMVGDRLAFQDFKLLSGGSNKWIETRAGIATLVVWLLGCLVGREEVPHSVLPDAMP